MKARDSTSKDSSKSRSANEDNESVGIQRTFEIDDFLSHYIRAALNYKLNWLQFMLCSVCGRGNHPLLAVGCVLLPLLGHANYRSTENLQQNNIDGECDE